ncbi:MAG: AraC family transcriptional regulator [Fusicatenibacter sp.]|nr:AraC family transcriptional regulator [Lachnospiraceae bacterium]MDY2936688.1 AraC family transcriptional regulator [Fusicatenibacter sp.]
MYTDSAYYHNQRSCIKDKTHPLFVESCGTYHLYTVPKLPTHYPKGRLDYQILYIAQGKGHFLIQGEEKTVSAGNMVIYRPKEEQRYYYCGSDQTEVYWIHFTGNDVKNILRKHGITDDLHVIYTGTSLEYKHLFTQIIQELKLCRTDYEEMLAHYLNQLLISVHRILLTKQVRRQPLFDNEMDAAVRYFHSNYNKPISIESYASDHNMSVSWFIRCFREYTNTTPAQYLLSLRISNARTLLENTSYNISEISNIIGYDNPLYFSRLFKKQCGVSPSEYRKQLL